MVEFLPRLKKNKTKQYGHEKKRLTEGAGDLGNASCFPGFKNKIKQRNLKKRVQTLHLSPVPTGSPAGNLSTKCPSSGNL